MDPVPEWQGETRTAVLSCGCPIQVYRDSRIGERWPCPMPPMCKRKNLPVPKAAPRKAPKAKVGDGLDELRDLLRIP
jgi:hypothetical protein